jgi:hypothetical protein
LEEAKNERKEGKKDQQAFAERTEARRCEATQKAGRESGIYDGEVERNLYLQLLVLSAGGELRRPAGKTAARFRRGLRSSQPSTD